MKMRAKRSWLSCAFCAAASSGWLCATAFVLLFGARAAWAERVTVAGEWYDQDKYHIVGDGPSWGNGWYNDLNDNGEYDPGEPYGEVKDPFWTRPVYASDGSCWMATAANLLRYVGGPDRYHAWAYVEGVMVSGKPLYWTSGGPGSGVPLDQDGYTTTLLASSDAAWPELDKWVAARIGDGLPVVFGVGGHVITCYGIDLATGQVSLADSDTDLGGQDFKHTGKLVWEAGSWKPKDFYGSERTLTGARAFATTHWKGLGAGGTSANWHSAANWTGGVVPAPAHPLLFPRVELEGTGGAVVQTGNHAQAQKLIVRGPDSRVIVESGAQMTLGALFIDEGDLSVSGTLTAHRADARNAAIMQSGGVFSVHKNAEGEFGDFTMDGSSLYVTGGGTFSVDGNMTGARAATVQFGSLLSIGGSFDVSETLAVNNAGQLTVGADLTLDAPVAGMAAFSDALVDIEQSLYLTRSSLTSTHSHVKIVDDCRAFGPLLAIESGQFEIGRYLYAGSAGGTAIDLRGGALTLGYMFLGYEVGGSAIMTLASRGGTPPALRTTGNLVNLYVGFHGAGEVMHEAGTLGRRSPSDVHPNLSLGFGGETVGGAHGHYTLADGSVTVGDLVLGSTGTGTFTQDGGSVVVDGALKFQGAGSNGENRYTLNGGSLVAYTLHRFGDRPGHFDINGGQLTLIALSHSVDEMVVGKAKWADAGFTLDGQSLTASDIVLGEHGSGWFLQRGASGVAADRIIVGRLSGSPSNQYLHEGGTVAATQGLYLGMAVGARGRYELSGSGSWLSSAETAVGYGGQGLFDHNAGKHSTELLDIGPGGTGNYVLRGGTLEATQTRVGGGRFRHEGGTHDAGSLIVDSIYGSSSGYQLYGGALHAGETAVGQRADGGFWQGGGTHSVADALRLGGTGGIRGYYDLAGGALDADGLYIGSADGGLGALAIGPGGTVSVGFELVVYDDPVNTLRYTLAGAVPGSGYGYLDASGASIDLLGGTLDIALLGYTPDLGDSFELFGFGALSGQFGALNLPALGDGLAWNTSQLYTGGILSIGLPWELGDFNGDGVLSGLDIPGFKTALADPDGWAADNPDRPHPDDLGDFNGDGAFSGLDIPGFKTALAGGAAAVPEPGTLALGVFGGLTILSKARRRRIRHSSLPAAGKPL